MEINRSENILLHTQIIYVILIKILGDVTMPIS